MVDDALACPKEMPKGEKGKREWNYTLKLKVKASDEERTRQHKGKRLERWQDIPVKTPCQQTFSMKVTRV